MKRVAGRQSRGLPLSREPLSVLVGFFLLLVQRYTSNIPPLVLS